MKRKALALVRADRSNGGYSIGRMRKQHRHWLSIHNTRYIGGYSKG